ncbi:hypothetical protein EXU57_24160 [Segetibacter sp. 3557_3]|uniref:hypothetical protein n=1 Tax=Segetibacter sp. 3557_3 TaxID=2547429 RepID=UPI0010591601|nr:hypothetical protein [Segetibacter sp. 3557_3]TDH18148.1 hypothetical protein EXU57_24160 [Segetibacter sp. 3557_3]
MINDISWASYWFAISIIVAFYYFLVIAIYYPQECKGMLSRAFLSTGRNKSGNNPSKYLQAVDNVPAKSAANDTPRGVDPSFAILPADVQSVMDEIEAFFHQASHGSWVKSDLIRALQAIVSKYPSVKMSGFVNRLNIFIKLQAELHCSIHLVEEELALVWM